jgi:DNA mismatch repair protein MutL
MSGEPPAPRPRVARLPPAVAEQIAAGEVITRPANVVRELVDNAVDAAARTVTVEIAGGGLACIRVVDDGHGMDPDEALLALERHATSKLRTVEDLFAIRTLGFRGEALPSIAAVSRLTLRTRPPERDAGAELRVEGGGAPHAAPCGCAPGTSVEVADLFYNVPARRKFLRAPATESAHVGDLVRAAALAHPGITVSLVRDGREVRRWLRAESRADRARAALGEASLVECAGERGPVRVEAFLAPPERARAGAGALYLFVNGRHAVDRSLARAVATAFGELLGPGQYPVGAVFVDLSAELVDVNVHPQKAEVRFAHARAVADTVYGVVASVVGARHRSAVAPVRTGTPREADPAWRWSGRGALAPEGAPSGAPVRGEPIAPPPELAPARRFVAQIRNRYLVCEDEHGIAVLDRREAATAWLLGRSRAALAEGALASELLLFPMVRELDEAMCDRLERAARWAERFGFELRRAGRRQITATALPRDFAAAPAEALFDALVAVVRDVTREGAEGALLERLARAAAPAPGHPMSDEGARTLACDVLADEVALAGALVGRVRYETRDRDAS